MTNMANPRNDLQGWKPRVAEFMGGHKPREMGNYGDLDVNPNENGEGLCITLEGLLKIRRLWSREMLRRESKLRLVN